MPLPNFLLIGAMKSGSTSLYSYLHPHPAIYMPEEKEPKYFAVDRNLHRGFDWYRSLFDGATDEVAIGEASTVYTKWRRHSGIPQRVRQALGPDLKFLYIVRDPVERIRSHYLHGFFQNREDAPTIRHAVLQDPKFLDFSRYASQLDQWLEFYEPEQFLVLVSEELRDDRLATLRRVYSFLGVDPSFVPPSIETATHTTDHKMVRIALAGDAPWRRRAVHTAVRVIPEGARAKLKPHARKLAQRAERKMDARAHVDDDLRSYIEAELIDEVRRLRDEWLGPTFNGWGIT